MGVISKFLVPATNVKNKFGEILDHSQYEPVTITKKDREVTVLLSIREFKRMEALEEQLLSLQIKLAEYEGYIGSNKSRTLIDNILKNEDYFI